MAPESFADNKFNQKTDVWALGVVLWQLLTGYAIPYHQELDPTTVVLKLTSVDHPLDLRLTLPSDAIFAEMNAVVRTCLEVSAVNRPTAAEVAERLRGIQSTEQGRLQAELQQVTQQKRIELAEKLRGLVVNSPAPVSDAPAVFRGVLPCSVCNERATLDCADCEEQFCQACHQTRHTKLALSTHRPQRLLTGMQLACRPCSGLGCDFSSRAHRFCFTSSAPPAAPKILTPAELEAMAAKFDPSKFRK